MSKSTTLAITSTLPLHTVTTKATLAKKQNRIPILGLGVYRIKPSPGGACQAACRAALQAGYRHIDTARLYRNEPQVREAVDDFVTATTREPGEAVEDDGGDTARAKSLTTQDIFLTTKIKDSTGDEERDYRAALKCIERLAGLQSPSHAQVNNSHGPDRQGEDTGETAQGPRTKRRRITDTTSASSSAASHTPPTSASPPYVDLILIHQPPSTLLARKALWRALERLHREGRARNIGVSNYRIEHLEELRGYVGPGYWPPSVNQIEVHPWFQQAELTEYCAAQGIVVQAFAPLAQGKNFVHEGDGENDDGGERGRDSHVVMKIARKYGKTQAQVLIRWSLQRGFVALPKSSAPERIRENADVFDFELEEDDMRALGALDRGGTAGATYKWNKA